jgi:hypothetical protein
MRRIRYKGMRGKSNVIKRNVDNVCGARYTLSARYLPKNTLVCILGRDREQGVHLPRPRHTPYNSVLFVILLIIL